ncbi:uncharacterized protein PAC_18982 [Phialocephala subalpina]|uniref:Uncharacterized protein n=1 Tax=Phialocephala subalpina TaxID=576137 RepID=A0A1L7XVM6_9HELO|nr:uncharacterized protein PAC_18982 [Phialocephala subalpina]
MGGDDGLQDVHPCYLGNARIEVGTFPINTLIALPRGQEYSSKKLYHGALPGCDRTGFDDPDVPTCEALCAPASNPCSGRGTANGVRGARRSIRSSSSDPDSDAASSALHFANESAEAYGITVRGLYLVKRVFQTVTQVQLPLYVYNQFEDPDPNFGDVIPLVETVTDSDGDLVETDMTVTVQQTLGNQAFQVGSRGIHGCTIVTIVSKRAVYMEDPAWAPTYQFRQRVLNWISGMGNRFGVGPALNVALFNAPNDDTRIFIMHPRRTRDANAQAAKRLNYDDEAQAQIAAGVNQYGKAVFQYDPNGRGQGQPRWRLCFEEIVFNDSDPPPPPAAINGVNDL